MLDLTQLFYSVFLAQAALAILLAVLLHGFQRQYRHDYLKHWTLCWWALAVHHCTGALALLWADLSPWHPARLSVVIIALAAGYAQGAWLLFGTWELASYRPLTTRLTRTVLAGLTVTAAAVVLFSFRSGLTPQARVLLRGGLGSLILGAVFCAVALWLWRIGAGRAGLRQRPVRFLLCGALLGYGLEQLGFFAIGAAQAAWHRFIPDQIYLTFLDFFLQSMVGLGMVTWLLEAERDRAIKASAQIEFMAYHDPLTGLPNRQLFVDRLENVIPQASRKGELAAVLFLDLDRFKGINDSLGHSTGDALLRMMAERLKASLREGDTVARHGGDEFTLLLPAVSGEAAAAAVAEKLVELIRQPFILHGQELRVTTSIGISLYPRDGVTAEALLTNADIAMYRAKEQGKDRHQFYAPVMSDSAFARLSLENDLRRAPAASEFLLHYQPIVDLQTGAIAAVEALLRWRHPVRGLLLPGEFIYMAENLGLLNQIHRAILLDACRQTRHWQQNGLSGLRLNMNVSARTFQQPELLQTIREVLADSGLPPGDLELEITETIAMQNAESTLIVLHNLKDLGLRISIDDFGTGYSALSYLRAFPIDSLKIDKFFLQDITSGHQDAAIVKAVIRMAHNMDLKVVGEGVETPAQREFLRNHRCDYMQGFLFSRGLPPDEFERLMLQTDAAVENAG